MPYPALNPQSPTNPAQALAELRRQAALGNRHAIVALANAQRLVEMRGDGVQGLPRPATEAPATPLDNLFDFGPGQGEFGPDEPRLPAAIASAQAGVPPAGAPPVTPAAAPMTFGLEAAPALGPAGEPLATALPLVVPPRKPPVAPGEPLLMPSRGGQPGPQLRRNLTEPQLESTAADAGPGVTPPGQPGPTRTPMPAPDGPQDTSPLWSNLLRFGLTTLAAGGQPGATTASSLGAGGLAVMDAVQAQRVADAEAARRAREESRDDARLELDREKARRLDPETPLGKARRDLQAGLITKEEFEAIRRYESGKTKAPPTRAVRMGSQVVTQEWTGEGWAEVGRGPAWSPSGGGAGGPTLTQTANNAEVDAARRTLAGLSREEILRRTQEATSTGRDNPDFDPQLARLVRIATQRKVGDDAEFEATWERLLGSGSSGSGGETVDVDGMTYDVLEWNDDGSARIRDPETGRVGTWFPGS